MTSAYFSFPREGGYFPIYRTLGPEGQNGKDAGGSEGKNGSWHRRSEVLNGKDAGYLRVRRDAGYPRVRRDAGGPRC
jgi:hypothetical protein